MLTDGAAWGALAARRAALETQSLPELFAHDPGRVEHRTLTAGDLIIDCSKHWVDEATDVALADLARERDVSGSLAALFGGEQVNSTEGRAAGHPALRAPRGQRVLIDGVDVVPAVHEALDRAGALAMALRSGAHRGATGEAITHVVNLGIGGSHLGPAMAHRALVHLADGPEVRFVSNVDGAALREALGGLEPATTAFIVCSKTFTTIETLTNARTARRWLTDALGEEAVADHFLAVSSAVGEAEAFGIRPDRVVGFWDWVGGRYSMWSAVGLCLMVAFGTERFSELLAGAHAIDEHVRTTTLERNAAVRLALLRVWYSGHWSAAAHAVVPYAEQLSLFGAHLQQVEMESLGKRVTLAGTPITSYDTGQVVFGTTGTDAQHAYFQLLHQGTRLVPVDFIGFARSDTDLAEHHDLLLANLLAQSAALAFGRSEQEALDAGVRADLAPHCTFPGGRPSTTILAPELTPSTLGQLVALYEHTTYVQAVLWGIDAFDQFGVELGKQMAGQLLPAMRGDSSAPQLDASTRALLGYLRRMRESDDRDGGVNAAGTD